MDIIKILYFNYNKESVVLELLKVEEYITKQKKEDKIDEFNFKKYSENMASIIKYVAGLVLEFMIGL